MLRLVVTASGCAPTAEKHRDVHGEIGQLHHGRAGDGAAGAEVVLVEMPADADAAVIDPLQAQAAALVEGLREFLVQQSGDLLRGQRRRPHVVAPVAAGIAGPVPS